MNEPTAVPKVNPPRSIKAIFLAARELPAGEELDRYLETAVGEDQELHRRVERMLASLQDAEPKRLAQTVKNLGLATYEATACSMMDIGEHATIGPYKIREKIAEGGMGVVYVAEQTEPVRRKVALKVIKPGVAGPSVVARFEAERQALAMMDHPNIARVLDGGATEDELPYFVMELVQGLPITEYCDTRRLNLEQRLIIFGKVCRAVQHAHQKGIIHRDLKPSNVLVATIDDEAVPKVIDFGVAKAVNQKLTEHTVYTQFSQMVGTPLYMSPEQAELGVIDIDTRSDVYSLGAMLFELLAGRTPFDAETMKSAGFDEMRRIIREQEPPRPSALVETLVAADLSTMSERRDQDPRRFRESLAGELDWIVMKSLEKDRNRRYESASALAADIDRYLHDQPIAAGPPSIAYRLSKFSRRNRSRLIAGALLALAVLIGSAFVVQAKLTQGLQRRQLASDVQSSLSAARAAIDGGDLAVAERQVAEARGRLGDGNHPDLRMDVQQLTGELSERLVQQQQFERFRELARSVLYEESFENASTMSENIPALKEALNVFSILKDEQWNTHLDQTYLTTQQQSDVSETAFEILLILADYGVRWSGVRSQETALDSLDYLRRAASFHEPTRAFYFVRSECHRQLKNTEQMEQDLKAFEEAEAITAFDYYLPGHTAGWRGRRQDAIAAYKAALRLQPDHFNSLFFLALRKQADGKLAEAAEIYRACLALRPDHLATLQNRAVVLSELGEPESALSLANQMIALRPDSASGFEVRAIVKANSGNFESAIRDFESALKLEPNSAGIHRSLGKVLIDAGRLDRALTELELAINIDPTLVSAHLDRIQAQLSKGGDIAQAEAWLHEAMKTCPPDARLLTSHGVWLGWRGKNEAAIAEFTRAIKIDPTFALAYFQRSRAYGLQSDYDRALQDLDQAIALEPSAEHYIYRGFTNEKSERFAKALADYRRALEIDTEDAIAHKTLAWMLANCPNPAFRDYDGAMRHATEAVEIVPDNEAMWKTLGVAQYRNGNWMSAITSLEKSLELGDGSKACSGFFLAMAHMQLGHEDQARDWYDRAVDWMEAHSPDDEELIRLRSEAEQLLKSLDISPKPLKP